MNISYLKFSDQNEAEQLLKSSNIWLATRDLNGETCYIDAPTYVTDVIGIIYSPIQDPITGDINELAETEGWHVNIQGQIPEELKKYSVNVKTPYRTWGA